MTQKVPTSRERRPLAPGFPVAVSGVSVVTRSSPEPGHQKRAEARTRLPGLSEDLEVACVGTGTVVVQAPAQVSGHLGGHLLLPCHLPPLEPNAKVTQVTWMRQDPEGEPRSVAVLHPTRGPSESERFKFVSGDLLNPSLNVSELRTEDEATYTCQVATFPMGSGSAKIRLRVLAQPSNTAEAQEVPLRPSTGQPVPVARCTSTRGRPPARVTWCPLLNGSAHSTQEPGPLPGTYTIVSLLTLVPSSEADGRTVTCRVEHESLEEPVLLPVTLTVRYPPEVTISGYDGNWYVSHSQVTLSCGARSNPAPTGYAWNTTTGSLPSFAEAHGPQLLISTHQSINATFICSVTNALGTRQKEQTILVQDPEGSHLSVEITVICIVLVFGVLIAAFLYYKRCYHRHCGRDHSRPLENGDVIYSEVRRNDPLDGQQEAQRDSVGTPQRDRAA